MNEVFFLAIAASAFVLLGALFSPAWAPWGVWRLPDAYTRKLRPARQARWAAILVLLGCVRHGRIALDGDLVWANCRVLPGYRQMARPCDIPRWPYAVSPAKRSAAGDAL